MTTDLDARAENREIRRWGRDNGWSVDDRGKIPADLRAAWETRDEEIDDTDDSLFVQADEPEDDDGPEVVDFTRPAGPPPPRNLDEAREQAASADQPAAHTVKGRRARRKASRETTPEPPPIKVTKTALGDIEGKLAFWLSLTAEPWSVADPYCGGAYADQVPAIAKAAAPLIAQSPDLVRWFGKSTTFLLWTELGIAVRPVATAVIKHHVTKRVQTNNGVTVEVQPGQQADWSMYASRPAA